MRTVEERGVRLVRLWFTDVLGQLKSFAISPAELENALEDGMTFDGSSIDGFSPRAGERRARRPRPQHVRAAALGRPQGARGPGLLRHRQPRRHAVRGRPPPGAAPQPRQGPRASGFTFYVAPDIEFFYFEPPAHGAAAAAARRGRRSSTSPPTTSPARCASRRSARSRRWASRSSTSFHEDAPEPAGDRPAPHRRAHDGRQRDDVPAGRAGGGGAAGRARHVHAQAARGRAGLGHAHPHVAVPRRRERVLRRATTPTTCRRSPSRSWPVCCATPPRSPPSPTRRSTPTSGWCPASRRRSTCRGPATTAAG